MAKLLLDENISFRLVAFLDDEFPGSTQVSHVGLSRADDRAVWDYARKEALTIVSKDGDFHHLGLLLGAPPKTVWLRVGNCRTEALQSILIANRENIHRFVTDDTEAVLIISRV